MRRSAALSLVIILVLAACGRHEKPLSVPGEKLYTVEGRIVGRDVAGNLLRVDHKAIPGFMEAMTMDYSVHGAKVAELPADGARIRAKLHVTDSGYWITDVRETR